MPIYGFRCEGCSKTHERYFPVRESQPSIECDCGATAERDFMAEARNHVPGGVYPYVTTHLNGSPIEVRSAAHLQELCKQHGKVLRDDAGYVEQSMQLERYRDRDGNLRVKPVYRDGGGDGDSPGRRWI